jgi:hypothetical protein
MSAYKKNVVQDARTHDIIYSMAIAAPAAIAQAKRANLPEIIGLTGGNAEADGKLAGQWIRNNVKYKIDTFEDQNIQLPSALLRSGAGDCKSFSMLFLAIMEAAGYNAGFRFASYKKERPFTHVYNFVLDNKNNILTFDTCIKDLKELKHYKKLKDMRVNYLAGVPTLITEKNNIKPMRRKIIMRKPTVQELMTDDRFMNIGFIEDESIGRRRILKKFVEKVKTKVPPFIQKGLNKVKTVALGPARGPFLLLVDVNFRGLARKLSEAIKINESKVREFWTKLGGDYSKLQKAVDKGKNKKPFLGERVKGATSVEYMISGEDSIMQPDTDQEFIGVEPATITLAITTATGIIVAAKKLFASLGVKGKPGEEELTEGLDESAGVSPDVEPGADFFANDPASEGAAKYAASAGAVKPTDKTPGEAVGFKASPILLIGAAAVGIFLLTRKNK